MEFRWVDQEDVFTIVERLKTLPELDGDSAATLSVGLRLFGNVILANKKQPIFANLKPHIRAFMKGLKRAVSRG